MAIVLPDARNSTYVNGTSEVDANDLNALQDWIRRLAGGAHGYALIDDFIAGVAASPTQIGLWNWLIQTSGTGAAAQLAAASSDTGNHGILELLSGSTASGQAGIETDAVGGLGGGELVVEALVGFDSLATVSEDYVARIGLANDGSGLMDTFFEYDRSASANWRCRVGVSGTGATPVDTGIAVTTGFQKIAMVIAADAQDVDFYVGGVDGTPDGSVTYDLTGFVFRHQIEIAKTAGTTQRKLLCDFYRSHITFTTAR